jgi:phosphate transport system permease protein
MGSEIAETSSQDAPDEKNALNRNREEIVEEIGQPGRNTLPLDTSILVDASTSSIGADEQAHTIPIEIRQPVRQPHPPSPIFNIGDRIFSGLTAGLAALILVIVAAMVATLVWQSRDTLGRFGLSFLYTSTWDPIHNHFGAAPAILGTVYTSLLALLLAAPVGIMVAIFLVEMAPRRIRLGLGFVVELLAAVPSIVYGLWALVVLVPLVRDRIQPPLIDHFGNTPLFKGYPIGLGVFTAALILSIMILPTIASISRDVMLAVPNSQRDAMLALGATRWETTWKAVIPYARSGIIGAIVLALGRAVGETMAVQMVIGNTQSFNVSLFNFGTTMPATIVNQFTEATGNTYLSALIELGLILMVVTIILNAIARLLVWRVTRSAV